MIKDALEEIEAIVDALDDKIVDLENELEDKNIEIGKLQEENERLKIELEYAENQLNNIKDL